ncbi:MAG TPA: peroxiredoxin-like family protein [Pseudonocardiaceae bacterium]|jgi:peroxiredoxin|nr:peroxiredoxin-like family protein [Pseudonocardiaceae bacterium]
MTDTYGTRVAALKAGIADRLPAEVLTAFTEEQEKLLAADLAANAAPVGTPLPHADLLDAHGNPTTLADALGGRPAVLVFYRGAWCPYCNLALRTYQEQLVPALAERGIGFVAISPQKPDGSLSITETNALTFTVLADAGNTVASALGILSPDRDQLVREAALALGVDVAATNGDGTDRVPMPTTIVADADGRITWIDVHPDYTERTEPEAILAALDQHTAP